MTTEPTERPRCPVCDRLQVDPALAHSLAEEEAAPLCFRAVGSQGSERECRAHAVDWRARALAAEAEREKWQALNRELLAHERDAHVTIASVTDERDAARAEADRLRAVVSELAVNCFPTACDCIAEKVIEGRVYPRLRCWYCRAREALRGGG